MRYQVHSEFGWKLLRQVVLVVLSVTMITIPGLTCAAQLAGVGIGVVTNVSPQDSKAAVATAPLGSRAVRAQNRPPEAQAVKPKDNPVSSKPR